MHEHMTHHTHVQQQLNNTFNIHAFTNNINIITNQQLLTIQVKEKIHHTMINMIFNTYQSFRFLHIMISNYPQNIGKIFGLKDRFRQVRLSF